MKKMYRKPTSLQIHLTTESVLMSGSDDTRIRIETGESTFIDTPEEALSQKQSSLWDNWTD